VQTPLLSGLINHLKLTAMKQNLLLKISPLFLYVFIAACTKSPSSDNGNGSGSGGNGNGNPTPQVTVSTSTINFPSTDSSYSITVSSNVSWTVMDDQSWITTSVASGSNNGNFSISVIANPATSVRSGTVTISGGNLTRTITVSQAANPNNNGVTLMRGSAGASLYYDFTSNGELSDYGSHDGFSTSVELDFDSSALVRTKLVNTHLGTMTATPIVNNFGYTKYEINFSNVNHYTNSNQYANPDTAGKLQIWIYREDGQNIIPASGNRPAVKRIIQVPGTYPTMPNSVGLIRLLDYDHASYPVHPPVITLTTLQNIFTSARWTFVLNQFTWPW
jgi:hypothetical protein